MSRNLDIASQKFMEKSSKKVILYTDGGSRGNPGPAAVGVVVCNAKGEAVKKYSETIGEATNNEAEYRAVIFGLKKIKQIFGREKSAALNVEIRSDSELLVKQNLGQYKIMEEKLRPLFVEIWNLRQDFNKVDFKIIGREKNREADRLVNEALDQKRGADLGI